MNAALAQLDQLFAIFMTALVLGALIVLALTEFLGARVPGFWTISETARTEAAHGDYRVFLLVLAIFLLGGLWWSLHVLEHL